MTCREKLAIEHPDKIDLEYDGGCNGCPGDYGYIPLARELCMDDYIPHKDCNLCWDQEVDETVATEKTYSHEKVKLMLAIADDVVEIFNETTGENGPKIYHELEQMELEGFTADDDDLARGIEVGLKKADEITNMINECKKILDSGERRQFETGAVRDIQEGKGRCDLMPLDVVGSILEDGVLMEIEDYKLTGSITYLCDAIKAFNLYGYMNIYTLFLDVAKHFEDGAKKYGENNWQKGIPTKHYIDSAVRHYLKHLRGDQDEPHDRAFVWNIMCCIWTCINMPELDSYAKEDAKEDSNENTNFNT